MSRANEGHPPSPQGRQGESMKKKAKQACRKQELIVRPMYEADEVTRTKAANAAVMRMAKMLRPLWKAMLHSGWKKWQVEKLMQEAVQDEACFINLLWDRPNTKAHFSKVSDSERRIK